MVRVRVRLHCCKEPPPRRLWLGVDRKHRRGSSGVWRLLGVEFALQLFDTIRGRQQGRQNRVGSTKFQQAAKVVLCHVAAQHGVDDDLHPRRVASLQLHNAQIPQGRRQRKYNLTLVAFFFLTGWGTEAAYAMFAASEAATSPLQIAEELPMERRA